MYLIGMLHHYEVKPLVVFDGAPLPAKSKELASRTQYVPSSRD
jgi:hypothetical protein